MDPFSSNTDDPDRPSIFASNYPPFRPSLSMNNIPGPSVNYFDNVISSGGGFNMRPQTKFGANHKGNPTLQFPFYNRHDTERVVQFGAPTRHKRKTDSPSLQPAKRLITEENMSEHLSKLKITSETPVEMESEEIKEKRLYMCEEMKRFHAQNDSIIPEFLLPRKDRSCTALVLWKPPESILDPSIFAYGEEEEICENNNNNSANYNRLEQLMNDIREGCDVQFDHSEELNRVEHFDNKIEPFSDVEFDEL